jgi:ubiquinone/menaquinone biosynthesis C-methylase UbiE
MSLSFDTIAEEYDEELKNSLGKFGGKDITIFSGYKVKIIKSKLPQTPVNILEFGCGTGRNNYFMKKLFPQSNIFGCDISEKSLEIACKVNPSVQYKKIANPADLIAAYNKYNLDCIFISNVLHHIQFNEHKMWFEALYKILSKEGSLFVFEHNPHNPITKHIFNNSEIDQGAVMVKPSYCYNLFQSVYFTRVKRAYTLFLYLSISPLKSAYTRVHK